MGSKLNTNCTNLAPSRSDPAISIQISINDKHKNANFTTTCNVVNCSNIARYNYFVNVISVADCPRLDPTWKHVQTEPPLPVTHGVEITLSCPADYTNKGGDKATCQDGKVVPSKTPRQCSSIGKLQV